MKYRADASGGRGEALERMVLRDFAGICLF